MEDKDFKSAVEADVAAKHEEFKKEAETEAKKEEKVEVKKEAEKPVKKEAKKEVKKEAKKEEKVEVNMPKTPASKRKFKSRVGMHSGK